jgi:hypothetical protein
MTIDKFRNHLTELRHISTDNEGREVLVGLTFEETNWFFAYLERRTSDAPRAREDDERYRALQARHELTRMQVVGAEIQKRTDTPTSH